jgi:hypothetical protein
MALHVARASLAGLSLPAPWRRREAPSLAPARLTEYAISCDGAYRGDKTGTPSRGRFDANVLPSGSNYSAQTGHQALLRDVRAASWRNRVCCKRCARLIRERESRLLAIGSGHPAEHRIERTIFHHDHDDVLDTGSFRSHGHCRGAGVWTGRRRARDAPSSVLLHAAPNDSTTVARSVRKQVGICRITRT